MSPALLLMFTFVIGSGSVLVTPAYQSLVPELVPRDQIPAAAQLSSINVNLARAIGPAIAGILIAYIGVGAVFALDAATFLVYGLVVALWRPSPDTTPQIPERFVSALRAGGRYVRYAPVVRRILLRAALFLVPASALWALLPLVASRRLGLGSERVRAVARRPRRRRHRRGLRALEGARPAVAECPHRTDRRGVCAPPSSR